MADLPPGIETGYAAGVTPTLRPLPTPPASGAVPSFTDRAKGFLDQARAGVASLLGGAPATEASPNVLAGRTGILEQQNNALQARSTFLKPVYTPPTPPPALQPIKPGAQPNAITGMRPNPTPATPVLADRSPNVFDARFRRNP